MALATATSLVIEPPLTLSLRNYELRSPSFHRPQCHSFRSIVRKSPAKIRVPFSLSISPLKALNKENDEAPAVAPTAEGDPNGSSFSVLAALRSRYNDIVVVDTPDSRFLLLDSTHNVHSMRNKAQNWTGSYWDEFASLPAIVPQGPLAILGLGGGTTVHLMLELWPSLHIEGWEIDEILIDMAREHFGLADLEKCTQAGGSLSVHIGDALSPSVTVEGGFAGIIVDLFSEGKVLPQLEEDATWLEIEKKLMPNGRIMVNCGGAHAAVSGTGDQVVNGHASFGASWVQNSTIKALCRAFPGKLSWKRMAKKDSNNYLALTGPLPNLDAWSAALPEQLSLGAKDWKPCELAI